MTCSHGLATDGFRYASEERSEMAMQKGDSFADVVDTAPAAPSNARCRLHYINGFLTKDDENGYVRLYPDSLCERYYFLVNVNDVKHHIPWSDGDLASSRVSPRGGMTYYSLGVEYGAPIHIVKMSTVYAGGKDTKILIGFTPQNMRQRQSWSAAGKYRDRDGLEGASGGGNIDADGPDVGPGAEVANDVCQSY
jgi:hypothetical protein